MNAIDPEDGEQSEDDLDLTVNRENRTTISQAIANVEIEVMIRQLGDQLIEAYELLSDSNKELVKMLVLGYKKSEIAEYLNIQVSAVSHRLETIAKVFTPFVQGF